jgi:cytochrome c oxidase cbb3-type subunit III
MSSSISLSVALSVPLILLGIGASQGQQSLPPSQEANGPSIAIRPDFGETVGGGRPGVFMQVPITHLSPGALPSRPAIKNPAQGDPKALERGMSYFISLNCVGCHAPNGGGGMGPALSNTNFMYGAEPENIYLSIYQGRPKGMPAWGAALPDSVIWDLVTYIGKISNEPTTEWGRTFAAVPLSPNVEQVPSEQATTPDPWSSTKNFSSGQKP